MLSSNITSYLLKITSIIFLFNLILFLLKNGKTKQTIKFVFCCIIVICAISPLLKIENCKGKYVFDSEKQIQVQSQYLDSIALKKQEMYKQKIENYLNNNDIRYNNIFVYVNCNDLSIEKVKINLDKTFINENSNHIVYLEDTKNVICNLLQIKRDLVEVVYDEQN